MKSPYEAEYLDPEWFHVYLEKMAASVFEITAPGEIVVQTTPEANPDSLGGPCITIHELVLVWRDEGTAEWKADVNSIVNEHLQVPIWIEKNLGDLLTEVLILWVKRWAKDAIEEVEKELN
jgi:hypothetical protein